MTGIIAWSSFRQFADGGAGYWIESVFRVFIAMSTGAALALLATNFDMGAAAGVAAALGAFIITWAFWRLGPALDEGVWNLAGVMLLAAICLGSLVVAVLVSAPQVGDYGVLWRCGAEFGMPIQKWVATCRSGYTDATGIYRERAFVYTVPIMSLFGPSYIALKLYNVVLHAATAALVLWLCNRHLGYRAGCAALTVLALQTEWWLAIPVASMDNLAVLLIVALIGLLASENLVIRPLTFGAALGVLSLLFQWSRSLGAFAILASLIVIMVRLDHRTWRQWALAATTASVFYVLINQAISSFLDAPTESGLVAQQLFALDVHIRPPQNYEVVREWVQNLAPAIPADRQFWAGLHRLIDALSHGFLQWPSYMAAKAAVLFAGDGNLYYATVDWRDNLDTIYTVQRTNIPTGPLLKLFVHGVTIVGLVIVTVATVLSGRSRIALAALAFAGAFIGITVSIGPVLDRYGILTGPAFAFLAGAAVANNGHPVGHEQRACLPFAAGAGILIGAYLLALTPAIVYRTIHPRALMWMKQQAAADVPELPCNQTLVPVWRYFERRVRSSFAPDVTCVSYGASIPRLTRRAQFFVTRERLPYMHEKLPPVAFEYAVRIGAAPLSWQSLGSKDARWHEIEVPVSDAAPSLQFVVRRIGASGEFQFEIRDLLFLR